MSTRTFRILRPHGDTKIAPGHTINVGGEYAHIKLRLYVGTPTALIGEAKTEMAAAEQAMELLGASHVQLCGNRHGVYVCGYLLDREKTELGAIKRQLESLSFTMSAD